MDNKGKQFEGFAKRVSGLVRELPNDGRECQMTATIGGDNHGNITFGNHITIHTAPPAEPEPEQTPPRAEKLLELER